MTIREVRELLFDVKEQDEEVSAEELIYIIRYKELQRFNCYSDKEINNMIRNGYAVHKSGKEWWDSLDGDYKVDLIHCYGEPEMIMQYAEDGDFVDVTPVKYLGEKYLVEYPL